MCLAVPGKILEIEGPKAKVDFNGVTRQITIALIADAQVGDYVVVHAGYAIEKMSEEDAQESLKLWDELIESQNVNLEDVV